MSKLVRQFLRFVFPSREARAQQYDRRFDSYVTTLARLYDLPEDVAKYRFIEYAWSIPFNLRECFERAVAAEQDAYEWMKDGERAEWEAGKPVDSVL